MDTQPARCWLTQAHRGHRRDSGNGGNSGCVAVGPAPASPRRSHCGSGGRLSPSPFSHTKSCPAGDTHPNLWKSQSHQAKVSVHHEAAEGVCEPLQPSRPGGSPTEAPGGLNPQPAEPLSSTLMPPLLARPRRSSWRRFDFSPSSWMKPNHANLDQHSQGHWDIGFL